MSAKNTKKMKQEIELLEAYIGQSLYSYITQKDTNTYERRNDIENIFKGISIEIETYNEEGECAEEMFEITDKYEIQDLKDKVESLVWDLEEQLESRIYYTIQSFECFKELCENLLYDYEEIYQISCCIYNLSKQDGISLNIIETAKQNKELFKTAIKAYSDL